MEHLKVNVIDRLAQLERPGSATSQTCVVFGCTDATRDKPWCPAHTHTTSPYALRIIADMAARAKEIEDITKDRCVKRDGFLVQEATRWLNEQPFTVGGLSRIMHIKSKVAESILRHLVRRGVGNRCAIRGKYAVSLIVKTPG